MFLSLICAIVISDLVQYRAKKRVKRKEERKVKKKLCWESCKRKDKDQIVGVHKYWIFISSYVTSLLYSFGVIFARRFRVNHLSLASSLFASSLNLFCVCVASSYLVISTRHWISSLDCYLTLQQLDFRLPIVYHPYQAPHKTHRIRFADLVFAQLSLLLTTTRITSVIYRET